MGTELEQELGPGAFGENLTTGVWSLGDAGGRALGVGSAPAGGIAAPPAVLQARRPHDHDPTSRGASRGLAAGAYLRIVEEGDIAADDA